MNGGYRGALGVKGGALEVKKKSKKEKQCEKKENEEEEEKEGRKEEGKRRQEKEMLFDKNTRQATAQKAGNASLSLP